MRLAFTEPYGDSVEAFLDSYLSPVSLNYVVNSLRAIESSRIGGIFHLSGSAELSYAEFARRLAEKLGVSADLVRETTVRDRENRCCIGPVIRLWASPWLRRPFA